VHELKRIWRFGLPFLRPYLPRFVLGTLLGILFGLSNGLFVVSVNTLFNRIAPAQTPALSLPASPATTAGEQTGPASFWKKTGGKAAAWWKAAADDWLPAAGKPISWQQALGGFLLLPLVMGFRAMTSYFSTYCLTWVSARVIRDMQLSALRKVQELSMAFFQKRRVSDLYQRIVHDTRVIYDAMTNGFIDTVREPFALLSIFVSMLVIDWKLTLISLAMLPLVVWPVIASGRRLRELTRRSTGLSVNQSGYLLEALAAVRVVKAYAMEKLQLANFRAQADVGVTMSVKTAQTRNLLNPLIEILAMLGVGFLILFVFYGGSKPGNLVAFLTALLLTPISIKRIANLHLTLQQTSVSAERLEELFREKPTVVEPVAPRPLEAFRHGLAVEGLSFSYGHHNVLRDIRMEIPRGKKVGLAGESGSGKSTLINLVMRFYDPTEGCIRLDGHDLREYRTVDLLRQMALVSQDVVLFNVSIAENIAFGKEGATRAEIEAAARQAYAHEFILGLPKGYDSPAGERGQLLSGGQKARIAIARAFIRNAPILILDEATAALDSKAEAEVQGAIDRLEEGRTVLCIAHRLSTLANMDEILVLDQGRIVEQGTFTELLKRDGTFAQMARRQGLEAKAS